MRTASSLACLHAPAARAPPPFRPPFRLLRAHFRMARRWADALAPRVQLRFKLRSDISRVHAAHRMRCQCAVRHSKPWAARV
eukprot:IDg20464t1